MMTPKSNQHGVSLIEVMVSVMVLAVGLLGLAALLGNAMQSNQHAQARTQAIFLAGDMMERMRGNRNNRDDYVVGEMAQPPACTSAWVPDGDATIAENDLSEWRNALRCNLPDGNSTVAVVEDDGNFLVTVTISWVALDQDEVASEPEDDQEPGDDFEQPREQVALVSEL
ncbi:MAG: type IV pilus modification protein PilV [Natronospirillum sp.]